MDWIANIRFLGMFWWRRKEEKGRQGNALSNPSMCLEVYKKGRKWMIILWGPLLFTSNILNLLKFLRILNIQSKARTVNIPPLILFSSLFFIFLLVSFLTLPSNHENIPQGTWIVFFLPPFVGLKILYNYTDKSCRYEPLSNFPEVCMMAFPWTFWKLHKIYAVWLQK